MYNNVMTVNGTVHHTLSNSSNTAFYGFVVAIPKRMSLFLARKHEQTKVQTQLMPVYHCRSRTALVRPHNQE